VDWALAHLHNRGTDAAARRMAEVPSPAARGALEKQAPLPLHSSHRDEN